MKKITVLYLFLLAAAIGFAGYAKSTKPGVIIERLPGKEYSIASVDSVALDSTGIRQIVKFYIPHTDTDEVVISHTGYSFTYHEAYEQARWVAYELTREKTIPITKRTNRFQADTTVSTGTAENADYTGSGFDRGHLAPAADMAWSVNAMKESFYFSNISPQLPAFNRGIWKKLEELVRIWAVEYTSVYVITGPVLTDSLPTIGQNQVAVPAYFYKVILDGSTPKGKGIGFILPNAASSDSLQRFAVTIDSVERLTGLNFFPQLPLEQVAQWEQNLCIPCWTWKPTARPQKAGSKVR